MPVAAALAVIFPAGAQLLTDADTESEGLMIEALATDSQNVAVAGVPVTFTATSGALSVASATTDASGRVSAILTTGGNTAPRVITITVTAGSVLRSRDVTVVAAPSPPAPALGILSSSAFTPGILQLSQSTLPAGGSSSVRVDIIDTANGNAPITGNVSVSFSSPCVSLGLASIDPTVVTSTGTAIATYRALGCSGNDMVVARATVLSAPLSASSTIVVLPSPPSAIRFISATPTTIGLRGTGQNETSQVTFRVTNAAGGPAQGATVSFALDTSVGGLSLTPSTPQTTDSSGNVQVTVNSGTVHTSVRVTATVTSTTGIPPAQSGSLVVSTGLADQNSFSLSVGCFNIEGDTIDGTTTPVTIRAADRFNNPVPDGTAVSFTTEGGQIQPQCLTVGGACSVPFTSQAPRTGRPGEVAGIDNHRYTVRATAVGEESFSDTNGNGVYDNGETFTDLAEAFVDANEDGIRGSDEDFLDFNNTGGFSPPSGNFTGVLCRSGCDTAQSLHVRASSIIIMSGSTADIGVSPARVDLSSGAVAIRVSVGDDVGQPMAGGTRIAGATTLGSLVGTASYTQACTAFSGPIVYTFVVEPPTAATEPASGQFTVTVTSPSGVVTERSLAVVFTPDPPPPPPPAGTLNSIQFVSALPNSIGLKGSGQVETSQITFRVLSDTGSLITNQLVNFALSTSVGGITLNPTSAVSDANGLVSTIVNAGTVHTSVRVTATATSGVRTVSTISDQLVVSTGIADQDSFSLSAATLNIEADGIDGVIDVLTARLSDRYNNPVPDGTAVAFQTEGGQVESQCLTLGGACSVRFVSSSPRNATHRYTVLASAIGEETFRDLNGNGDFDPGEPFGDLSEAYLDRNESGNAFVGDRGDTAGRDAGSEEFIDFAGLGVFDGPSGDFNGVSCIGGTCSSNLLNVSGSLVLVMSSSSALIAINPSPITLTSAGGAVTVLATVADTAGQSMSVGTTVTASITSNDPANVAGTIAGPATYTQADTNFNGPTVYPFTLVPGPILARGTLTITVRSPRGLVSSRSVSIN